MPSLLPQYFHGMNPALRHMGHVQYKGSGFPFATLDKEFDSSLWKPGNELRLPPFRDRNFDYYVTHTEEYRNGNDQKVRIETT